ncbi:DUF5011 domain-containing protein [Bifidobacterium stellenboschense]|nr:DUF5011 domain-containing protein [Bifidobacterium stellenboschense]
MPRRQLPQNPMEGASAQTVQASGKKVVSKVVKNNGGKGYLEVDGKPFTMVGTQSFAEWQTFGNENEIYADQSNRILDQDWLENTFEKVKMAGFNTIQIEFMWNQIEAKTPGNGHADDPAYDWTLVDKYIAWANKYDLRIDWVWFGPLGCTGAVLPNDKTSAATGGVTEHGYMTNVPEYLWDQGKYFGRGTSAKEMSRPWIPVSDTDTKDPSYPHRKDAAYMFSQERKAVQALFEHLGQADKNDRTIMFQIWNEPNWHPDYSKNTHLDIMLDLANQIGKVIKESDYSVATRMNYSGTWLSDDDGDPDSYDYIDFYGPDSYTTSVETMAEIVRDTAKRSDLAYIPETYSGNENITSILSTILVNGGFVDFWQINDSWAQPKYALWGNRDPNKAEYKEWKLGVQPEPTKQVLKLQGFLPALHKMDQLVAVALPENMAAFNNETDAPQQSYAQQKRLGSTLVGYTADDASVGMAVYNADDHSYNLISDTQGEARYRLEGLSHVEVSEGSYDANGQWKETSKPAVAEDGSFTIKQGQLIRVVSSDEPFDFDHAVDAGLVTVNSNDKLPATLPVDGKDTPVTWFDSAKNHSRTAWEQFSAQGYVTQPTAEGKRRVVNATINVVPDDLVYFIDSGSSADKSNGAEWKSVVAAVPGLSNTQAPDRQSSGENQWGYVGTVGTHDGDDKWGSGLYANGNVPLQYRIPLKKGTYRFTSGINEWWENRSAREQVTYTIDGETKTVSGKSWSLKKGERATGDIVVTLPEDTTVTYEVISQNTKAPNIAWLGVSSTPRPLGLVGAVAEHGQLPDQVEIDGTKVPVAWNDSDAARSAYATYTAVGTATIGSGADAEKVPVTADFEIVPDGLVYYIDSGATSEQSKQWKLVKDSQPELLNADAPDRQSTAEGQWGYINTTDNGKPDVATYNKATSDDKWETGLYAADGAHSDAIRYRLPLKKGRYHFTAGVREWWETRYVGPQITYTTAAGEEKTVSADSVITTKGEDYLLTLDVDLPEDAVVTYANVAGTGGKKPLISWLGVSQIADKTTDTTAPVFKGVDDVTVDFGAAFDPLAGVTASDDVDGDVTSSITVEGAVDTSKAGDYMLTYTVSDKAGNKATATRKVTVKAKPAVTPTPDTTKPETKPETKPNGKKPGAGLSKTGASVTVAVLAVVALLGGGAALTVLRRRNA